METTQDGDGAHATGGDCMFSGFARGQLDPLRQTLVWTVVVKVLDILAQDAPQLDLAQDQEMIRAVLAGWLIRRGFLAHWSCECQDIVPDEPTSQHRRLWSVARGQVALSRVCPS